MREPSQSQITLYRCKFVLEKTGLKRSSLYKLISLGAFPKPIKITAKAVAWPSNEVEAWIQNRILAGQQNHSRQSFNDSLKGAQ
jgi:prophage regulatory protein